MDNKKGLSEVIQNIQLSNTLVVYWLVKKFKVFYEKYDDQILQVKQILKSEMDGIQNQTKDIKTQIIEHFSDELINIFRFVGIVTRGNESVKFGVVLINDEMIRSDFYVFKLFCQTIVLRGDLEWNLIFVNLDHVDRLNLGRILQESVEILKN